MGRALIVRSLSFPAGELPAPLLGMLAEFRLIVNKSIRIALREDFVCIVCDWEMDRQHNAGLNILKSALASNEALARAVWFRPGALREDVVSPLYDLPALPAGAREGPSGEKPQREVITP